MELILSKPVVVALAVLGAGISMLASFLQTRNHISAAAARGLNYAGYAFMAASMLLFALAALWR